MNPSAGGRRDLDREGELGHVQTLHGGYHHAGGSALLRWVAEHGCVAGLLHIRGWLGIKCFLQNKIKTMLPMKLFITTMLASKT